MGAEIERKFLVTGRDWQPAAAGVSLRQGYLSLDPQRTVRVRIAGETAFITIKGLTSGIARREYEYAIPVRDATEMLDALCHRPLIEKTRYHVEVDGTAWSVDQFHGENDGLIVAEVELRSADQAFARPAWLGQEVSHDARYFNSNLIESPYRLWRPAKDASR
jgi:adenylate cyclase